MVPLLRHIPRAEARALTASMLVGILLLTVKFVAYFITSSAAIFSDAVESIANVLASGVAAYSLVLAHTPPDQEHPYGHGKVEFLSAWFEGGMIFMAAIFIFVKTVDAVRHGEYLRPGSIDVGVGLMLVAMLANGATGIYLLRTGRRHNSMTLEADGKHLISDAYTSLAVIAALLVARLTGWREADPIMALLVAVYIAWMASGLLKRAAAGLMDKQDVADEATIRRILDSHVGPAGKEPQICSYHKLRHRHSGRYVWVDVHMLLPADMTIERGHALASALEYEIEQSLGVGTANATAHIEPWAEPQSRAPQ